MPPSPRTPSMRTHLPSKSFDSIVQDSSPQRSPSSRKDSQSSIETLASLRPLSSERDTSALSLARRFSLCEALNGETDVAGGYGTLADELAEVCDEDEEAGRSQKPVDISPAPRQTSSSGPQEQTTMMSPSQSPKSSIFLAKRPEMPTYTPDSGQLRLETDTSANDADQGTTKCISFYLDAQMVAIDRFARQQIKMSELESVEPLLPKMTRTLRNLPTQAALENGTSRLITTHTALTSHVASQARSIHALVHPIISPLALPPDEEVVEEILPLLATLLVSIPRPNKQCLSALHNLQSLTTDLQSTLVYLTDSLYVSRQVMLSASRKLRTVVDLVVRLRQEAQVTEAAIRWIEKGDWEKKLVERECQSVCGDVVGGFEQVCNHWRQRLVAGTGAA